MRKLLVLTVATGMLATCLPAVASAHRERVSLRAATRLDQRVETRWWDVMPGNMIVRCRLGRHGNAGCDYSFLYRWPGFRATGSGATVAFAGGPILTCGHDAIVRRHGRLRVLFGAWMHACP